MWKETLHACKETYIYKKRPTWESWGGVVIWWKIWTRFFQEKFLGIFVGKTCLLPISRNSRQAERKSPGRGGVDMKKSRKVSPANHIAWINLVLINMMHQVLCLRRFAQESYIHTCSTQVTAPGFSITHVKRDLHTWKETNICEMRPTCVESYLHAWKETCTCEKRPTHVERDLHACKETQKCQKSHLKRPTYVPRDLHIWKRHMYVKRDLHTWNLHVWKKIYICEKRHRKETYISHLWLGHVTHQRVMSHANESCHKCDWVMARVNASCHTCKNFVTHITESCRKCECVTQWPSHVTHETGSYHLWMRHVTHAQYLGHILRSHVINVDASRHKCRCVTQWPCHVTPVNASLVQFHFFGPKCECITQWPSYVTHVDTT